MNSKCIEAFVIETWMTLDGMFHYKRHAYDKNTETSGQLLRTNDHFDASYRTVFSNDEINQPELWELFESIQSGGAIRGTLISKDHSHKTEMLPNGNIIICRMLTENSDMKVVEETLIAFVKSASERIKTAFDNLKACFKNFE